MRKLNWPVKLVAVFALVLIASLLFQLCYILPRVRDHETARARKYIEQTVRTIAYDLTPRVNEIKSIVPNIARLPEFRSGDKDGIQALLDDPPKDWFRITALLVMDGDSNVLAHGIGKFPWQDTADFAEAERYTIPLQERRTHVDPPQYDRKTGIVSVTVGALARSRPRGSLAVVIGRVRLNELMNELADYPLEPGYVAYVQLSSGQVIAHSGEDLFALAGGPLSLDYKDHALSHPTGEEPAGRISAFERHGEPGLRACVPLGFNSWRLVVEAPMQAILAPSKGFSHWLLVANVGFFGIALAISILLSRRLANQRNQVEKALRVREERFREMFNNMSTGGQILEALPYGNDFIIKDINRAAASIAKIPREESIGKKYTEVFPEHAQLEFFKHIQQVWQTGEPLRSAAIIIANGVTVRWQECYLYKLPAGEIVILIDDVTERQRTADALEAAETKYRDLVQTANSIIVRLSGTGIITFMNDFAQRFFGYAEDEVIGHHIVGTLLPETDSTGCDLRAMLKDALTHPEKFATNENENMRKNGERVWISWTNRAVCGADGEVKEYFCVGNDITKRRHAENNLRTRLRYEEGLAACSQTLLTQTPDALAQTLHHLLLAADVSRVCIQESFEDPVHGTSMRQQFEVCAPDVSPSINYPNPPPWPYKKGMMRWAEAFAKNEPIVGVVETFPQSERDLLERQQILSLLALPIWVAGELYGFIGFDHTTERRVWNYADILLLRTASDMIGIYLEHQRTEAALRESELRLRSIFAQTAAAVMLLDAETGEVLESNAKAYELLGRPSGSPGLLKMAHLEAADPDGDVARHIAAVLTKGQRLSECRLRTKDGHMRHVLLDCKALRIGDRNMIQTVWFDISERRKAERALNKSHEELRELAARLQNIREEESSRISREIHDELGQGLTGLNLNLAWLQKHLPALCDPHKLNQIKDKVALMTSLVNQAIRKIQQIATDLRPSALDLGLIEAVEWEIEQFRERTGLPCELSIMGGNVILGDASSIAIFRILQEALTNVARHAEASHVWVSLKVEFDRLILQVTDDGCGCDDADLEERQSLGIRGMRERAFSVSGDIAIEGVPGEGTSVNVSVPLRGGGDANARPVEMISQ